MHNTELSMDDRLKEVELAVAHPQSCSWQQVSKAFGNRETIDYFHKYL
jgi:hypothetical protein